MSTAWVSPWGLCTDRGEGQGAWGAVGCCALPCLCASLAPPQGASNFVPPVHPPSSSLLSACLLMGKGHPGTYLSSREKDFNGGISTTLATLGTTMILCLGNSIPPMGTSPSLGPKQATSIAEVKTKKETETKAHILAAQPASLCSQPPEPIAG